MFEVTTITTTSTTTTTTTTTKTTTKLPSLHFLFEQYRRANPYEFRPLTFNQWKRRHGYTTRVRRTSLRSNEIPSESDPSPPALKVPKLDHPSTPAYRAVTEPAIPNLPEWHVPTTDSRVHFQGRGKMIGSLNFAHLVLDLDLKGFVSRARSLCGPEAHWMQNIQKVRKSARNMFQDLIGQYEQQCKQLLYDLEQVENAWLKGDLNSAPHARVKRQFFLAGLLIGAAVVAAASYFFSNSALLDISMGNSQNPLTIRHLQDHETRVSKNERSVQILKDHVEGLDKQIHVDHDNIEILSLLMQTGNLLGNLVREVDNLLIGLHQLLTRKFSMHLIESSQMLPILKEMKLKLAKLNLVPAIMHSSEVYDLECSYLIFANGTIRAFVHIPAYREGSLMDLHQYLGSPVHVGDGHFIHPQPFGVFLSSNQGNTLFRSFTPEEFSFCKQVSGTFYCKGTNWYRKRYQDSCLINLFLGDTDRIREHCQFVITKETEILTQINHKTFHLFSLSPTTLLLHCPGYGQENDHYTFTGSLEIRLNPECSSSSPSFEMEGSADVFGGTNTIKFHELDILSAEDFTELKDNFKSLPHKSLDLVGSTKGLKITDIKAEFAAQKQAYHFRVGLIAGTAILLLLLFLGLLLWKCCPCSRFCKWLFSSKKKRRGTRRDRRRARRQRSDDEGRSSASDREQMEMQGRGAEPSAPSIPPAAPPRRGPPQPPVYGDVSQHLRDFHVPSGDEHVK